MSNLEGLLKKTIPITQHHSCQLRDFIAYVVH